MINTYVSYQLIAKDIGKSLDRVQDQPVVERETEYYLARKKVEADDAAGFLAGLSSGWDALKTLTTGAATVVGALLPFTALLLLVGVPAWLLLKPEGQRG